MFVQRENHLAIAARPKLVAVLAFEPCTMLLVIVDFTVADEPDGPVLIREWLMTTGEIDDGKPPMTERREVVVMNAFAVRSTMTKATQHALNQLITSGIVADDSRNAAHELFDRSG
jgi:hypothetical protein